MYEKMFATKFLRDETQIKQDWICLIMKDENAPLDVAYKANLIKIQREYYPYAVFDVTCEAEWHATSIWEHVEEYQVPHDETVYIDYKGNEHKSPGQDTEVRNLKTYSHYRKPVYRTVYDTERRTVTDNVQQTSGYIEPTTYSERVWTGKGQSLLNWADHFGNSQFIEINEDYLNNFVVKPEGMTREEARMQAENMGFDDIGYDASGEVPGDRYENLKVNARILEVNRTSFFLGVYHIFYEYGGIKYECLMSGGTTVDDAILGDHPIDDSIKIRNEEIKSEINKNGIFSKKTLFFFGAIALSIWAFIALISFFSSIGTGTVFVVVNLIQLLLVGAADGFCIYKYLDMKKKKNKAEAERTKLNTNNANLKQKIYNLVQNDSVPEEEKKAIIEKWLRDYQNSREG